MRINCPVMLIPWTETLVIEHAKLPRLFNVMLDISTGTSRRLFTCSRTRRYHPRYSFEDTYSQHGRRLCQLGKQQIVPLGKPANRVRLSVDGDVEWSSATVSPSPSTTRPTDAMSYSSIFSALLFRQHVLHASLSSAADPMSDLR